MLKAFSKFLFLAITLFINVLPAAVALYGYRASHPRHLIAKQTVSSQSVVDHGIHDASWEFIKKKHLSSPPVHLKLRPIFAIFLVFGLFFCARQYPLKDFYSRFLSRKAPLPVSQKYLRLQTLLI